MAWCPGHIDGTAEPGAIGNCVVSAHRDTQFAVLRDVRVGDEIVVQTRARRRVRYRVVVARVTDDRDMSLLATSAYRQLTLITCWPFDAIRPGGHGRYAVIARGV
jgi:sortase A